MAKSTCKICGAEEDKVYPLQCPTLENEPRTIYICYDCHRELVKIINEFIDNGGDVN